MPKEKYICHKCKKEFKRHASQVRNQSRVFCSIPCQVSENNRGKNNPNFKHGKYLGGQSPYTVCPKCGGQKDPRAKMCSKCRGRGFPVGHVSGENPLAPETARRRLYNSEVLYRCGVCGLEPWWFGEQLTLHMDHIDGNRTNNRKENLRWLCPNCHSQTSTQGRKKAKMVGNSILPTITD